MSDFTYRPLSGAQESHDPRVLTAKFGDGYSQRVADGINTDPAVWQLQFAGTLTTILAIHTQIAGYGGVTSFTWTPYGRSEIRVICPSWSNVQMAGAVASMSARFEQVFES